MKIGIHHLGTGFSDCWIKYCITNGIDYKIVNCYDNDIIAQLADCDALMWHWHHGDAKAVLFARQLILSLENIGKVVFPNVSSCWHFDDKIGQKYLLEASGAPLVPSYVFYSKEDAFKWISHKSLPVVFKLRGGAGSVNVKLVRTRSEARRLISKAFNKGFSVRDKYNGLNFRYSVFRREKNLWSFKYLLKGVVKLFITPDNELMHGRERGYVYFQEFLESNLFDTRVIIVAGKCFAIRRYNREGDFRASGSGLIKHDPQLIDRRCIIEAFKVYEKLNTQSIALDFIFDKNNNPFIVEISYAFTGTAYTNCPGYWDKELNWHNGPFTPQHFMVEDVIDRIKAKNKLFINNPSII